MERDANLLQASRTLWVGEWEARGLYALDGSRSAAARLARDAGIAREEAAAVLRRARKLRSMPATAAAFARGELSVDKVDLLCRANGAKREAAFAEAEERLVSDAKRLSVLDLRRVLRYWIDAADDAAAEDRAQQAFEDRFLDLAETIDGTVEVSGRLDAVRAAIVGGELARLEQQLFEEDWAAAQAVHGLATTTDHLARTARQRRADAWAAMATRSSAVAPGCEPARPLFTVLVDQETARQVVCELAGGTKVTPGQLAPWVTEADFERIVFGPGSRITDVGRRSRFFRGALRRLIEVRDRHCTFPGCTVAAERCQVDHVVEWCDGGETTQDNGRLRCGTHNRQRPGRSSPPPAGP